MITLKDIAERAGVHTGAVSYVLNDKPKAQSFRKETRERIIKIANDLGYRRNAIAQSMKTGKTNVIGIIGGLYNSYAMKIVEGINIVAANNNYMIKLLSTEPTDGVKNIARQCVEQRLAGVICRSLSEKGLEILRSELVPNNIPIVLVDSSFSHDWCSRVVSDDFDGAKQATEYLLKLGHSRIMHFTNDLSRGFSRIRRNGFCAATGKSGMNKVCIIDHNLELTEKIKSTISGALLSQKPTAVFCASDPIAMKLIIVASELGLKIPDDLSVIGFAGLDYTIFSLPPLTTIKQPFIEMGSKASKILLSEIKEKSIKQEVKIPVKLIIRDSCKEI